MSTRPQQNAQPVAHVITKVAGEHSCSCGELLERDDLEFHGCDHEWEEHESGPVTYGGGTEVWMACLNCGLTSDSEPGSGVL